MTHRSHVGSKEAKLRGWGRVPPLEDRVETYSLGKEVGTEYMSGEYLSVTATGYGYNDSSLYDSGNIPTDVTYPYQTWVTPWVTTDYNYPETIYPSTVTIREIIKEKVVTKEVEQRTLFRVYVVDPRKGGKILLNGEAVIALNENQAMLKAGIARIAADEGREVEDFDVYVEEVGTFIRPRKDTQRVNVVKTDEDD